VLVHVVEGAVEAGDVGGRAAHVERDHPPEPGPRAGERRADHAAGGTAQQAVLGTEVLAPCEAAGARHHAERPADDRSLDAAKVAADDRAEVGVDHGGLGAQQELRSRRDGRGACDPAEPLAAEDGLDLLLVRGPPGRVDERDRGALDPEREEPPRLAGDVRGVERLQDRAVRSDALAHLDDLRGQRLGLHHVEGEEVGALLVPDAEEVPEPPRDEEAGARAPPRQQRVRAESRREADLLDPDRQSRRSPRQDPRRERRRILLGPHLERGALRDPRHGSGEIERACLGVVVQDLDLGAAAEETEPEAAQERPGEGPRRADRDARGPGVSDHRSPQGAGGQHLRAAGLAVRRQAQSVGERASGVDRYAQGTHSTRA
jgi:hypothetical protein